MARNGSPPIGFDLDHTCAQVGQHRHSKRRCNDRRQVNDRYALERPPRRARNPSPGSLGWLGRQRRGTSAVQDFVGVLANRRRPAEDRRRGSNEFGDRRDLGDGANGSVVDLDQALPFDQIDM